ncbi:putative protein [Aquifex aeolicus VF5]|uniref:Metallophosphoesterase TT1561-like domain-containing protein n=2 Tax=Aquifex aeolicus TaxID=63363 RepID=O67769_AQUAE|nr:putative protein [Aquifex aeolicus VF5]
MGIMPRKVLAIKNFKERFDLLPKLKGVIAEKQPDILVVVGNILKNEALEKEYERAHLARREPNRKVIHENEHYIIETLDKFFREIGELGVKTFVVPGKNDAPLKIFLRAAYEAETAYPNIRVLHEGFAGWRGEFEVIGFGGLLTEHEFEEDFVLKYPRWYVEYILKFVNELKPRRLVTIFYTPPIGEFVDRTPEDPKHHGSAVVNTIIKSLNPEVAIVGHVGKGHELVGNTIVVNPGEFEEGRYAFLDLTQHKIKLEQFS